MVLFLALNGPLVALVAAHLAPVPRSLVGLRPQTVPVLLGNLGLDVRSPEVPRNQVDGERGQARFHSDAKVPNVFRTLVFRLLPFSIALEEPRVVAAPSAQDRGVLGRWVRPTSENGATAREVVERVCE